MQGNLEKRNKTAWCDKGNTFFRWGRCSDALGCYDRGLETDPNWTQLWSNRVPAEERRGRREEAVHCYQHCLTLASDTDRALNKETYKQLKGWASSRFMM